MKRIDAHQHFWKYDPQEYPWIQAHWPIRRDFLPEDLQPLLAQHQLDGSIAVQARQSLQETEWLLSLADVHPSIGGVVGWVDLQSNEVEEQIKRFIDHPKFVGVRHVVQDEPDDRFLLKPEFLKGMEAVANYALTYDILIFPKQLPAAIEFVRKFPEQPFVLDHIAKPHIKDQTIQPWQDRIAELASYSNVHCKISGIVTEADWNDWSAETIQPYIDVVVKAFGWDRLMYGSDWPVCLLAGQYDQVHQLMQQTMRDPSIEDLEKFFGLNALKFYNVQEECPAFG